MLIDLLQHGLLWGLVLSVYLSIAFVGLAILDPEMWLNDYPPDIRERYGGMSRSANRKRWLLGLPVMAGAVGLVLVSTVQLVEGSPGAVGFWLVVLHTFIVLMVFNIVDLLVIDWLLFIRWQPDFVVLPGTEGMAGYEDYRFHWHAFLKGSVGIVVVSLLVAAGSMLAT